MTPMVRSFALTMVCGSSLVGCAPAPAATDAGTDAPRPDAARADAGAPGDSVTFRIVQGATPGTATAAAACAVSIVAPGPRRFEGNADAEGVVTLSGFSWGTDGRISASFFSAGHAAFSLSSFSRADYEAALVDDRFEVFLPVRGTPTEATLRVSGTATGLTDAMDVLYVQPTLATGTTSAGRGPGYDIRVPPAVAFRLLFTDLTISRGVDRSLIQTISRWALSTELGPLSTNLVRDVDLVAEEVTATTSSASFVMPDAPFFRDLGSEVNVVRTGLGGELLTGLTTTLVVGADERTVDFTLSLVDVPGVTDARSVVTVSGPLGSSTSGLDVATPSGLIDPRLLTPPTIDETASRPLFMPVPVTGAVSTLETRVRVEDTTGALLWTVAAPLGATSVAMPALPFGTTADALGTAGTPAYLAAQLCELRSATARTERCLRTATSARVLAAVP